eukprot:s1066_g17.t2
MEQHQRDVSVKEAAPTRTDCRKQLQGKLLSHGNESLDLHRHRDGAAVLLSQRLLPSRSPFAPLGHFSRFASAASACSQGAPPSEQTKDIETGVSTPMAQEPGQALPAAPGLETPEGLSGYGTVDVATKVDELIIVMTQKVLVTACLASQVVDSWERIGLSYRLKPRYDIGTWMSRPRTDVRASPATQRRHCLRCHAHELMRWVEGRVGSSRQNAGRCSGFGALGARLPIPCWYRKLLKRHFDGVLIFGWGAYGGACGEQHLEHDVVDTI